MHRLRSVGESTQSQIKVFALSIMKFRTLAFFVLTVKAIGLAAAQAYLSLGLIFDEKPKSLVLSCSMSYSIV